MIDWTSTSTPPESTRNKDKVTIICESCKAARQILYVVAKRRDKHLCMSCIKRTGEFVVGQVVTYTCIDCKATKEQKYRPSRFKNWRCHHCAMVQGHKDGKFVITPVKMTDEVRAKISKSAKKSWQEEGYRERQHQRLADSKEQRSAKSKEIWSDEARLKKLSASIKSVWADTAYRDVKTRQSQELWNDDEYVAKQAAGMADPEAIEAISEASIRLWGDKRAEITGIIRANLSNPEVINKLRSASIANWKSEEYRSAVISGLIQSWDDGKRMLAATASQERWSDEEYRTKTIEAIKQIMADPAVRHKLSEASRLYWSNEDNRLAASVITKKLWESEEYYNTVVAALKTSMNHPDVVAKLSTASIANWHNQEYRNKVIIAIRNALSDPTIRQKISEASKHMWTDDTYRQHIAKVRASQPRVSSIQLQLYKYLDDLGVTYFREGPETAIGWYAFDCLVPDTKSGKKLLIECQGEYWHSLSKAVRSDKSKFTYIDRYFPDHEIMYVWEHEFCAQGRVLDRLKLKLGLQIDSVDFKLSDVVIKSPSTSELRVFLDAYHYIGKDRGGLAVGAYVGDVLVGCVVYSSPLRHNTAGQFGLKSERVRELSRLCIHPCYHRHNFGSWLIARSLKALGDTDLIVAYADTTMGHSGTVYLASNFVEHHRVPPDYWYIDKDGFVMHKRTLYGRARRLSLVESVYADRFGYVKKYGGDKICFIRVLNAT